MSWIVVSCCCVTLDANLGLRQSAGLESDAEDQRWIASSSSSKQSGQLSWLVVLFPRSEFPSSTRHGCESLGFGLPWMPSILTWRTALSRSCTPSLPISWSPSRLSSFILDPEYIFQANLVEEPVQKSEALPQRLRPSWSSGLCFSTPDLSTEGAS